MRQVCLPHTQLPGTSALFADYLYHFERVSRFYTHSPHDPDAFRAAANEAQMPDQRRSDVVAALRRTNGDNPSLDELDVPGTVAVVTGQQVGLFSGPAYTVYKALTAAKLARQLSESGIRAVPVFWLATEDHDFAEIDHVGVFGPDHDAVKLKATGSAASGTPVGTIPLLSSPVAELKRTLDGFLYADEITAAVEEAYQPGRTFGEAFRMLLQRLLSGHHLIFLDPLEPAIRSIAAPFLRSTLEGADELSAAVRARSRDLQASGYHAQVLFEEQSSFLFLLENGRRLPLRMHDGAYFQGTRRIGREELMDRAESLSPNALLRPVLQDYLLPTAAYVGGPAELAYLAQSQVLYQALLGRAPVAVSRSGFTLLDERAHNLMERYDITLPDTLHGHESLKEQIAARLVPSSLAAAFDETDASVQSLLDRLQGELAAFDPTLGAAMAKSKAKMLYQLEKNRRKSAREALRRNTQVDAGAAHLSGLLFPERHLQERYYSILPFLAKHGPDLLDTLYENVHRGCPDHLLLTV
jgi:bacillithiol synthase